MLFSLVFSLQRAVSPEPSTPSQELLHLTVSKRITQIQNVKGNISAGACLAALWLGKKVMFEHLGGCTASTQHCCKYFTTEVVYTSKIYCSKIGVATSKLINKPQLTEQY